MLIDQQSQVNIRDGERGSGIGVCLVCSAGEGYYRNESTNEEWIFEAGCQLTWCTVAAERRWVAG